MSRILQKNSIMNLIDLSEQEVIRRNSMEQLRSIGVEPYPAAEYVTNAYSNEIKASFKDDADRRPVQIAGRIMSRRIMGKASFMELQDSEGRIQVYITRDDICPGKTKSYTTPYLKSYSTLVTLLELRVLYSVLRWEKFPFMQKS